MKYEILGHDMQALCVQLNPGEKVFAEAGAMLYMTDAIEMNTTLNSGHDDAGLLGGLMSGLKRVISGATLFVTTFKAGHSSGEVSFSAPYPGKIMPLDLRQTGDMLCQRHAFLCAEAGIDISVAWTQRLGAGFFGGEGFVLQKLSGHGTAFVHSGGMILPKTLAAGETLRVNVGSLVAMSQDVDYSIQAVPGIKTMLFGGEGIFFATLKGPGIVYLQTLPLSRLADHILHAAHIPTEGASSQGGGVNISLGNFLGG